MKYLIGPFVCLLIFNALMSPNGPQGLGGVIFLLFMAGFVIVFARLLDSGRRFLRRG